MVAKTGYLKNFLRKHEIGPVSETGEFDETGLMPLAKGVQTVDPSTDEDTEDYSYYDGNGSSEKEVTNTSLGHEFSGHRAYGDPALEFVRDKLTSTDRICSFRVTEPDGRVLSGLATISEPKMFGGDANTRSEFEFTVTFNGMPKDEKPSA
ncbi:phage tail tube protein [Listeria aquatica]|uniref:phage tail tube protein n=1 Tax=Listeria aquatica TaxID=1494960 RepID=UPI003EF3E136